MTAAALNFSWRRQVPLIMQTEIAECGLACIAMVANYFGHSVDMTSMRQRLQAGSSGMTLPQMMALSEQLQFSTRALQCPLEDVEKLKLPCILHWDMNHFVVLTKVSGSRQKKFTVNDPGKGKRCLTRKEFSDHFTGICLEMTPTSDFKPKLEKSQLKFHQLWSESRGLYAGLVKLLALSLLLQFAALLAPYYMQWVVDEVLIRFDESLLTVLALGFTLLLFITCFTNAVRTWLILRLSSALNLQMGSNLMSHLLQLDMRFFESRHIGDLVSRFGSLAQIRERITTGLIETLVDGVMSVALLVMMFVYSKVLALVVIIAVLIFTMLRLALYRPLSRNTEELIQSSAKEQSHFLETARNMQSVKLFAQEPERQNIWQTRYVDVINQEIKIGRLKIGFETGNKIIFGLENILVIYLAATQVMSNTLTIGMLLAFIAYKNQFTTRMINLIEQMIQFKMMRLHLDRIADIALHPKEEHRQGTCKLNKPKGKLELINVSFDYQTQENRSTSLLSNINLALDAGQCIAITGPSGAGKSTLMKIMLGLLQPTSGQVLLDGQDIQKLGLVNYRKSIAGVLQGDSLLAGSIADNVCFFDASPNFLKIEQCCRLAAVHQEITEMPMAYQTPVGDLGSSLSGGQIQRLLMARALYQQPSILFMDEATSHLDARNERLISQQVAELNMTRIIIAHRQETLNSVETIFDLHHGALIKKNRVEQKQVGC
ncbi:peptidase domain-containing ABC transporter [Thalassotalea sp. PS06]|uniref:peptidase domain-containing ABC transporter n=1 Tax=Thalassotalea sp. PS06 TaxID=2594005 RepID=UPI001163D4C9|nr:peptidase domain-containing ABC transporter [Thalassotalea sp. PS06]QDP01091.1 peptidase domain-containing ABC transporter [Thalassotalea sp. PS06]